MPERKKPPQPIGVGMPYYLRLCDFGEMVRLAFQHMPYLVGSALEKRDPRDIDVRVMFSDEEWDRHIGPGTQGQANFAGTGWAAHCQAWSALGTLMVGKPIDFQIQHRINANALYGARPRLPLAHFAPPIPEASPAD